MSRFAVGLLLVLFASQSIAMSEDGKRRYRKYLADYSGSDTVVLAMDANGAGAWTVRPEQQRAQHLALEHCKKGSSKPATCKIVDVDGQSAWWRGGGGKGSEEGAGD